MASRIAALIAAGEQIDTLLAHLPDLKRLGDFAKVEAELKLNIERLTAEQARIRENDKAQARNELKAEAAEVMAKARADAAKLLAEAQAPVDAINAEVRMKQKRLDAIIGDIERGEKRLEEFHRVKQALAG